MASLDLTLTESQVCFFVLSAGKGVLKRFLFKLTKQNYQFFEEKFI
jgi:hypothetical protein